jgi:hypothetical protein
MQDFFGGYLLPAVVGRVFVPEVLGSSRFLGYTESQVSYRSDSRL